MRTTLTLDPDVAQQIRQLMAQKKLPLKRVVNEALRTGLAANGRSKKVRSVVEPRSCKFKARVDVDGLNQLVDELEAEDFVRKMSR